MTSIPGADTVCPSDPVRAYMSQYLSEEPLELRLVERHVPALFPVRDYASLVALLALGAIPTGQAASALPRARPKHVPGIILEGVEPMKQ